MRCRVFRSTGLHQNRTAMRSLLSGVPFMLWNRGRRLNVD